MRKLFIDDIRNAPDEKWTVARTIGEAVSAIDTFHFDVISIDHDISHQVMLGRISRPYPCEETFTPICYYIKEKYRDIKEKPMIIIHTANPAGAMRMKGILDGFDVKVQESIPANRLEMEV